MEETFGEKLKKHRRLKNLTQKELAQILNTSKSTIANYETNHSSPDLQMISEICNFFDISTDYMCGRITRLKEDDSVEYIINGQIPMYTTFISPTLLDNDGNIESFIGLPKLFEKSAKNIAYKSEKDFDEIGSKKGDILYLCTNSELNDDDIILSFSRENGMLAQKFSKTSADNSNMIGKVFSVLTKFN